MEPEGISDAASWAPLRICNKTGTDGGMKATPLIVKLWLTGS